MRRFLALSWWMLVFRGAAALAFGALTLAWPTLTLFLLVVLFSVYVLAIGAPALMAGFRTRREDGWWLVSVLGLASIAAGVLSVLYPRMSALVLVLIIGARAHHWARRPDNCYPPTKGNATSGFLVSRESFRFSSERSCSSHRVPALWH